ncbi:hypothetical protein LOTGIDRAFT_163556 [Lottia gigantea]|uniref:Uncharacterized protein n=1 Tax=Lottia gigantea TaxID=225164 RepID=V3ZID3_LOTGI|nr:hypothetical protein LOTGIDRAFT_163556 [Lottia gigantea]ESO91038.1 hypothetical protein LOTGIDRAFT_163556 [Lottia gigantea]
MYHSKNVGIFLNKIFMGYCVNGQVIGPCHTLNKKTTECQSGDKALPVVDYPSVLTIYELKGLFLNKVAVKKACKSTNKEKYRAAAVCVGNSYRHCADNDFKTLIPSGEKYGEAIDFVCDNEEMIPFFDCGANKLARGGYTASTTSDRSALFSQHKQYYCGVEEITHECARDDIDVQACLNAGAYNKYVEFENILQPSAC